MGEQDSISEWTGDIHVGDAREVLSRMPESSVHMCMTSPPYWQLRDYGDGLEGVWGESDDCSHTWTTSGTVRRGGTNTEENQPNVGSNQHTDDTRIRGEGLETQECEKCGAWKGQLGLEPTIPLYVEHIVEACREIRRVLRPDGCMWLNIGDSYDTNGDGLGLGRKQKGLVPDRVRIALQEDGWTIRNNVTWKKVNPMPSPVKDRLNETTESVVFATPSPDYYFDLDAIREPHTSRSKERMTEGPVNADTDGRGTNDDLRPDQLCHPEGKNPGDVFRVVTKPFPEAHFAVYPEKLCVKPIQAGCPPDGVVLDPFAGAGTTLKVADELGREWVGIEINEDYTEIADERMGVPISEHKPATDW